MADLRGQQLKDSYQNVVTRGTGNKLENGNGVEFADLDDKASLSGGADANFTLMPQVGGVDIVERDSNDDGEWIRFEVGVQIVFTTISDTADITTSQIGGFRSSTVIKALPISFIDTNFLVTCMSRTINSIPYHDNSASKLVNRIGVIYWRADSATGSSVASNHIIIGNWK